MCILFMVFRLIEIFQPQSLTSGPNVGAQFSMFYISAVQSNSFVFCCIPKWRGEVMSFLYISMVCFNIYSASEARGQFLSASHIAIPDQTEIQNFELYLWPPGLLHIRHTRLMIVYGTSSTFNRWLYAIKLVPPVEYRHENSQQ